MIIILLIILLLFVYIMSKKSGSNEFVNVYSKIPHKQISDFSETPFRGIYLIENDKNDTLPVWKIAGGKYMYVWNAGWDFLPFARFHMNREILDKQFRELIEFQPKLELMPYRLNRLPHKLTILEKYTLFRIEKSFSELVDYFQEEVRMLCKRRNKNSHWDLYNKMKFDVKPLNGNHKKYMEIQDLLWQKEYSCTEIDPQILSNIIWWARNNGFSINSILDMSAGRGARMIASIACPQIYKYTGVDPNTLSHEWYETQSYYFTDVFNKSDLYYGQKEVRNFTVLKGGFVETDIRDRNYDMMFSSPPYFDLEVYSDDPEQSVKKNSGIENWLNNFMLASMKKIIKHLRPGGLMCININVSRVYKDDWVTPLLAFNKNCTYMGCISTYKKEKDDLQPIWIWVKDSFRADFKINTPIFSEFKIIKAKGNLVDIKKYSVKIKNTVTFLEIKTDKIEGLPVWKYVNGTCTILINNSDRTLPITIGGMDAFKTTGCKWSIIEKKPYLNNRAEKVINVETGTINNIRFVTDRFTMKLAHNENYTPWEIYFKSAVQLTADEFYEWAFENKILCPHYEDSVLIAVLEFLKMEGFSLNSVYVAENDAFQSVLSALMYVGAEFVHVNSPVAEYTDAASTLLNVCAHKIKKWSFTETATFDAAIFAPPQYEIDTKILRLDLWVKWLAQTINGLKANIVVFVLPLHSLGNFLDDFIKSVGPHDIYHVSAETDVWVFK